MASRKNKEMKQKLLDERDKLLREREAIDNQIKGVERAIALLQEDAPARPTGKRAAVKSTVLSLLEEVGTTGLNAEVVVNMANQRGITLEKGSVSSLLSRLKHDDVAVFDGEKYRLKKFASSDEPLKLIK